MTDSFLLWSNGKIPATNLSPDTPTPCIACRHDAAFDRRLHVGLPTSLLLAHRLRPYFKGLHVLPGCPLHAGLPERSVVEVCERFDVAALLILGLSQQGY